MALAYTITAIDDPETSIEVIGLGGVFGITIGDDGAFSGEMQVPEALGGPMAIPFQGTLEVLDEESVRVTFTPEVPPLLTNWAGPFELDGDDLRLEGESTFDFGAGEVPVQFVAEARR